MAKSKTKQSLEILKQQIPDLALGPVTVFRGLEVLASCALVVTTALLALWAADWFDHHSLPQALPPPSSNSSSHSFARPALPFSPSLPGSHALALCALVTALIWLLADGVANRVRARRGPSILRALQGSFVASWLVANNQTTKDDIGAGIISAQLETRSVVDYLFDFQSAALRARLVPLVVVALVALIHWPAAVVLACTAPVMVVFLAMAGMMLGENAKSEQVALHRLSTMFADRIRCVPTIVGMNWQADASERLEMASDTYRAKAFKVIRLAFINSSILEFFASISVAILAVFYGLGHLDLVTMWGFQDASFGQSLPALILAVEFFNPFRKLSAEYHLKAKGEAALEHFAMSLAQKRSTARRQSENVELVLPHTAQQLSLHLPPTGIVVITGPSGQGKSTLLDVLFNVQAPVVGAVPPIPQPRRLVDTRASVRPDVIAARNSQVGELLLNDLPVQAMQSAQFSGGQRQRLALVQTLLSDARTIGLDEPTAKLDQNMAQRVIDVLVQHSDARLLIIATHDPALVAKAHWRIDLETPQPIHCVPTDGLGDLQSEVETA